MKHLAVVKKTTLGTSTLVTLFIAFLFFICFQRELGSFELRLVNQKPFSESAGY